MMQTVHRPLNVGLSTAPLSETPADILFLPVFEEDDLADVPDLDAVTGGEIGRARARGEFTGRLYDLFVTPIVNDAWKVGRVALVGGGAREQCGAEVLRRVATVAGLAARQRRAARAALVARKSGDQAPAALQAMAEGLTLANFEGGAYKAPDDRPHAWLETALLVATGATADLAAAVERGRILGESSNVARALVNEPGNILTPRVLAERAEIIAAGTGLSVDVLDEQRIDQLSMMLLMGVARGSREPPRVVVLRHEPKGLAPGPVLGLVGKGITFDSGGISIKPAEHMDQMKDDMSGGAAVIAAMTAIARLNAPVRVVGVIPAAENMPGGRAVKPGDVLRGAAGKTVEVKNTDAEGRLALADGVWYARQLGATHLVDVATLTGACVVALGKTTSGLFGTPDWWVGQVQHASRRAGDRSWPMPVFADYREQLSSEIADMTNTGGRSAGAITAALFIKEFAGDLPWVHMDIAGTAWADEARPYQPKGATGVGVRTMAELAMAVDAWRDMK
jgi:leucyl aminopeptidase